MQGVWGRGGNVGACMESLYELGKGEGMAENGVRGTGAGGEGEDLKRLEELRERERGGRR